MRSIRNIGRRASCRPGASSTLAALVPPLLLLAACRTLHIGNSAQEKNQEVIQLQVPFFASRGYDCGPAALASILAYWNIDADIEDIREQIVSDGAEGTLTLDVIWYCQEKGLEIRRTNGTVEDIRNYLHNQIPVILFLDYGIGPVRRGHYVTVTGCRGDGIIAHSGKKANRTINVRELKKRWQRTKCWMLAAAPAGRMP